MYFKMVTRKISRLFQKNLRRSKMGTAVSLIVMISFFTIGLKTSLYVNQGATGHYSLHHSYFPTPETTLATFVMSDRESFDRRNSIRKSWALGHNDVFFVVGGHYCPYPSENRVFGTCISNNNSLSKTDLKHYIEKQEMITRKILDEQNIIFVPSSDSISEWKQKVTESYRWALRTLRAKWFLHVADSVDININELGNYLKTVPSSFDNSLIMSSVKRQLTDEWENETRNKPAFYGEFRCGLNHVVSRCIARYEVSEFSTLFEYVQTHSNYAIRIIDPFAIKLHKIGKFGFVAKDGCNTITDVQLNVSVKHKLSYTCVDDNSVETMPTANNDIGNTYSLFENPSNYLYSNRFDLIVKSVYAYFYVFKTRVPTVIKDAYTEHLRVWNNFKEYSTTVNKKWYDAKRPYKEKRGSLDFITSFHSTIDAIKMFGFNSTMSRIPVDKTGFLLNGAHRLAASIVLSKSATFEHQNYEQHFKWGFEFFKRAGLSERMSDIVMLEWMKLQLELPYLKKTVSIVSVYSDNLKNDDTMRKLVKERCSDDNGIVYEKRVKFTKQGVRQLITHMYGHWSWVETKIQQMLLKGELIAKNMLFLFVYGKDEHNLFQCKTELRKLYNDKTFKSIVHIPETTEENLILAQMILNANSLQFMNYATDASDCYFITKEIASRSGITQMKTLPGMYLGRDDIMINTGAVLGFFGLRQRSDLDILFLQDADKSILGGTHGVAIQAHAFKGNTSSEERAWGEDHFSENGPKNQWDLFYDPKYYGYCYGIKFVSLQQLVKYVIKRNGHEKDQIDVRPINQLLKTIIPRK